MKKKSQPPPKSLAGGVSCEDDRRTAAIDPLWEKWKHLAEGAGLEDDRRTEALGPWINKWKHWDLPEPLFLKAMLKVTAYFEKLHRDLAQDPAQLAASRVPWKIRPLD